jgi:hypothetical protein
VVEADDAKVSAEGKAEKDPQWVALGTLKLPAGERQLRFAPETPAELSLFEVVLKPAK